MSVEKISEKIQDIDELLSGDVGETKKIKDVNIRRLTATGENYGSILLKVDVTLRDDKDGTEEALHLVAKCIPSDEFFRKLFDVQVTCKVEIAFYGTVVPTLQQFQRGKGVEQVMNFFPRMWAHRINLNGSDIVDEDAVLLLENVAEAGYKNVDRFESFDLPTIKLILQDLAAFHAVPLALKLLEPALFQSNIKPYLKGHPQRSPSNPADEGNPNFTGVLFDFLESIEECKFAIPHLKESEKTSTNGRQYERNEPFVSMGHGDLWVNNIMTRFENGRPVANKFVDFQAPEYQSPMADFFFLLWSSVQIEVLERHFDELVRFYHECFISNLRQLKCDTSPFPLEVLLDQLRSAAKTELLHVLFMTAFVIFHKVEEGATEVVFIKDAEGIPKIAKERMKFMLKSFRVKGWL